MRLSREALVTWTLRVLAPVCVLLAVIGAVRNYSSVPHWDMWPGYVEFWVRLGEGHWREWWALHNEHRIVLARVLFWIDHAVFGGTIGFLLVVNYLLVFGAFLTFRAILLERAGSKDLPPWRGTAGRAPAAATPGPERTGSGSPR